MSQEIKLGKVRQKASSASAGTLSAWNCRILPIVTWGPPAYIDPLQRTWFHSYTASQLLSGNGVPSGIWV